MTNIKVKFTIFFASFRFCVAGKGNFSTLQPLNFSTIKLFV
jgi:hypothetical protein